jgi:hypothetical protein
MSTDPELDLMFGELLSLIAGRVCSSKVFGEAEKRRAEREAPLRKIAAQRRRALAAARRAAPAPVMASRLAVAVATGDRATAGAILSRPRSNAQWRELALILAAAAAPEKLAAAVVPSPKLPPVPALYAREAKDAAA